MTSRVFFTMQVYTEGKNGAITKPQEGSSRPKVGANNARLCKRRRKHGTKTKQEDSERETHSKSTVLIIRQ